MKKCALGPSAFSWITSEARREAPGNDLLQILMDARYSDGEGMSDELVLSESMQLLVAGHENIVERVVVASLFAQLAADCLERLRQEFDSVLGDAPLGYADVPKFTFATQVIQEGLRLYPPFWMVDRMALSDDRAGDLDIPRGSTVMVLFTERTIRRGTGRIRRASTRSASRGQTRKSFTRPSRIFPSELGRGAVLAATTPCCRSS